MMVTRVVTEKKEDFFAFLIKNVSEDGSISVSFIRKHRKLGPSQVNYFLKTLEKEGEIQKLKRGIWLLKQSKAEQQAEEKVEKTASEKKEERKILFLTIEERSILKKFERVEISKLDECPNSRFTEESIMKMLKEEERDDCLSLISKLLEVEAISKHGIGTKGQIFNLNEVVMLEYLTNEDLIKICPFNQIRMEGNIKKFIEESKKEKQKFDQTKELLSALNNKLKKLEKIKTELEKERDILEKETKKDDPEELETRLKLAETLEKLPASKRSEIFKSIIG